MGYDFDIVECVSKLVVERAFPRGPPYVLRDSDGVQNFRTSLERLESCGFVGMMYEQGGCSEWQLTEAGMNDLIPALTIDEPKPAIQVRLNIPLEDKTSHELLGALEDNGWVWQRRQKGHQCPPYTLQDGGSEKLFYTSGLALCTKYAQCLLSAPRLAKLGVLAIEHCKPPTYHSKVLRGNPPDPAALPVLQEDLPLGIEDGLVDVEIDGGGVAGSQDQTWDDDDDEPFDIASDGAPDQDNIVDDDDVFLIALEAELDLQDLQEAGGTVTPVAGGTVTPIAEFPPMGSGAAGSSSDNGGMPYFCLGSVDVVYHHARASRLHFQVFLFFLTFLCFAISIFMCTDGHARA
jgi:hypothetical protein